MCFVWCWATLCCLVLVKFFMVNFSGTATVVYYFLTFSKPEMCVSTSKLKRSFCSGSWSLDRPECNAAMREYYLLCTMYLCFLTGKPFVSSQHHYIHVPLPYCIILIIKLCFTLESKFATFYCTDNYSVSLPN